MTRTMYDGITPSQVPAGADLYAGYVDGEWPSYAQLATDHPTARHVAIAVFASDDEGIVLDVENGDATPQQSVGWVQARRSAGADPTVYCNELNTWPSVRAAFQAAGVAEPHYWVANYSLGSNPPLPAGAVALQWADMGGYDVSVVADFWPGVDPAPGPALPEGFLDMLIISADGTAAVYLLSGSVLHHVQDPASLKAYIAAGVPQSHVSAAELAQLLVDFPPVVTLSTSSTEVSTLAQAVAADVPTAADNATATVAELANDLAKPAGA